MVLLSEYGLNCENSGHENAVIFQRAVDFGGDVYVDKPGIYVLDETIYLKSNTKIIFCAGSYIKRERNKGETGYVFINEGAYNNEYNENITLSGLKLICNDVCSEHANEDSKKVIMGLSGHVCFSYIKRLVISDFECLDLPAKDFGIQISSFEDVLVENVHIEGRKDGVHFGPGKRFVLRHATFKTFDDPIALNSYDYSISNPAVGWIADGIIEDCCDLDDIDTDGYFCRMSAGGWVEWFSGMEVQWSDTVSYNGRLYRVVLGNPDGKTYKSFNPPDHEKGYKKIDGITWYMFGEGSSGSCGCRNISFRDIYLEKKRGYVISMSSSKNAWCRNYYPNAEVAVHENISFENVRCKNNIKSLIYSASPFKNITFTNCTFDVGNIFLDNINTDGMIYPTADITIDRCDFKNGIDELIVCEKGRNVNLKVIQTQDKNFNNDK